MTTDLTGDYGLGEDEFDWDVFLPDPDESEIAAEAAALEDEAELDLDDSDFDWEAALREDGEPEDGADDGARAGAAYDRIVDMVRRSFEEESEARRIPTETPSCSQLPSRNPRPSFPWNAEAEGEADRGSALRAGRRARAGASRRRARGTRGVRGVRRARARGRPCVGIGVHGRAGAGPGA